jgi:putative transposase
VFPQTIVRTCIVHLIRNGLAFVSFKDRRAIMPWLKAIYRPRPPTSRYPGLRNSKWNGANAILRSTSCGAGRGCIFFAFSPAIRKMIYTTNCVESLNRSPRKIIKTRASFSK